MITSSLSINTEGQRAEIRVLRDEIENLEIIKEDLRNALEFYVGEAWFNELSGEIMESIKNKGELNARLGELYVRLNYGSGSAFITI